MGGFLSFLGGAGAGAASVADKYREQEIASQQAEQKAQLEMQSFGQRAAIHDQYEQNKERRALDPETARQKAMNDLLGVQMKDEYSDKRAVDLTNDPVRMKAIQDAKIAEKAGDVYVEGIKSTNSINLEKLRGENSLNTQRLKNDGLMSRGSSSSTATNPRVKDLQEQLKNESNPTVIKQLRAELNGLTMASGDLVYNGTPSKAVSQYQDLIDKHAKANGVSPALVSAMMSQESAGNSNAVSSAGATGLMQLMPETAQGLGVKNIRDPDQNIGGGTKYYKQMSDRYSNSPDQIALALSAYNAGPGAVDKAIAKAAAQGKDPSYENIRPHLPKETRAYVPGILGRLTRGDAPQETTKDREPLQLANADMLPANIKEKVTDRLRNAENPMDSMELYNHLVNNEAKDAYEASTIAVDPRLQRIDDHTFKVGDKTFAVPVDAKLGANIIASAKTPSPVASEPTKDQGGEVGLMDVMRAAIPEQSLINRAIAASKESSEKARAIIPPKKSGFLSSRDGVM